MSKIMKLTDWSKKALVPVVEHQNLSLNIQLKWIY
jgi:hypothetical protein